MARATQSESFPWILTGDTHLVAHKEALAEVKPISISELICYSAQKFGIMQVNVTDHDLQQKTTESRLNSDATKFFSGEHFCVVNDNFYFVRK